MNLTDNNAVITAIANDYGYENVFVKQLEALYSKKEIFLSQNLPVVIPTIY